MIPFPQSPTSPMQPFYQGKIDNFCAFYAVLNALKILHGITASTARDIFNEVVMDLATDREALKAVLEHRTDYVEEVDRMLLGVRSRFPFHLERLESPCPAVQVWEALRRFADPQAGRTAVFRFRRFVPLRAAPVADHWTTAHIMDGQTLRFFDCSLEPYGLYSLQKPMLVDKVEERGRQYVIIAPESVRLLSVPKVMPILSKILSR